MKNKKSNKKYTVDPQLTDTISNQTYISDIRQQLREAFEELQQYKLSSELEGQKSLIIQQQCTMLKQQNKQLRVQLESLKKQLIKYAKKYEKMKEMKNCEKCRENKDLKEKGERQREVFMKERAVLKGQINELKKLLQKLPVQTQSIDIRTVGNIQQLRKEMVHKDRIIQDQKKIIKYLDGKLSLFQKQKTQTLNQIQSIDNKLQQLQMQNLILKGLKMRQSSSQSRKNGSIKNIDKIDKIDKNHKSNSKYLKISPTKY